MADYDSDSSAENEDVSTNVLLGYASREPTVDDFSQLGGLPTWLDGETAPDGRLSKCKVCNSVLCLLLQLNGDLLNRFPSHERRLYVFGCRRKACRRKTGSVRAVRAVRTYDVGESQPRDSNKAPVTQKQQVASNLGETLFGVKSPGPTQANPFSSAPSSQTASNPFSGRQSERNPVTPSDTTTDNLAETFAQKASISSPRNDTTASVPNDPPEAWSEDPKPFTSCHVDADTEYLDPAFGRDDVPSTARVETNGEDSSSAADDKTLFESSMDKTFQRFADRLSQNPEQVLRYEYGGQPLLYSKTDAIGKQLASATEGSKVRVSASPSDTTSTDHQLGAPRCTNCGGSRLFELQLTPHMITVLEADEMAIDGMEWGTVILGVCSEDCQQRGKEKGEVGYLEEWVGVQWEEVADHRPR